MAFDSGSEGIDSEGVKGGGFLSDAEYRCSEVKLSSVPATLGAVSEYGGGALNPLSLRSGPDGKRPVFSSRDLLSDGNSAGMRILFCVDEQAPILFCDC